MSTDKIFREQRRFNHEHDTHALPPQYIHDVYKRYLRMSVEDVDRDLNIVDFSRGLSAEQSSKLTVVECVAAKTMVETFETFLGDLKHLNGQCRPCAVYEHSDFPGLKLYPGLLPPEVQVTLVDRLLHRDLSNPLHKTNLHDDYVLPYVCDPTSSAPSQPASFFTLPQSSPSLLATPRDPSTKHKPLNLAQILQRRWRWLTLGTQYDWTTRKYPAKDEILTHFPSDIAHLVSGLFPSVRAESGVVLTYSPKDFMPVHRDVSEMCERELCSFSLGCDGLFIVALEHDQANSKSGSSRSDTADNSDTDRHNQQAPLKTIVIRVKSGDMIQMSGVSRWAWHAMPKVMAGTCPDFLRDWPMKSQSPSHHTIKEYEKWRGYMGGKRINISCRQVYD